MKRSEMVKKLCKSFEFNESEAHDYLNFIEGEGMLPPEYTTVNNRIFMGLVGPVEGDKTLIRNWYWEDEDE